MEKSALTFDMIEALLEPLLHRQIDVALGSIRILWGMKYLAVGGTEVWDIWVKLLKPALDPDEVDCIVVLNVEFRCAKFIPKDMCYVIRLPNHNSIFQDSLAYL